LWLVEELIGNEFYERMDFEDIRNFFDILDDQDEARNTIVHELVHLE